MGKILSSDLLQGDLGETYFEHYCVQGQNKYAYIHLEEIYRTLTPRGILHFHHGWHRLAVKIPDEIYEEVRKTCIPSNNVDGRPSFVFDYLTFSMMGFRYDHKNDVWVEKSTHRYGTKAFNWAEVKTGHSPLSANQEKTAKIVKLPVWVFRIETEFPKEVPISSKVINRTP